MSFYLGWIHRPTGRQGRGCGLVDIDVGSLNRHTGLIDLDYADDCQRKDYFYFEVYPKDVKEFDADTAKLNAEREKKK